VAASIYGEPRLTADIDVVLLLPISAIRRLCDAFPEQEYYVPPLETLLVEAQRPQRGMFDLIHHASDAGTPAMSAARRGDRMRRRSSIYPPVYATGPKPHCCISSSSSTIPPFVSCVPRPADRCRTLCRRSSTPT
jgi:hypothetical protein